jgi:indolepyruvate decarboxylase
VHGTYLGVAGHDEVTQLVESSDLLLMLGCILSDSSFGVAGAHLDFRRALIAAGREVRIGHHVYPDIPLAALVRALLERARPRVPAPLPGPIAHAHGLRRDDAPVRAADLGVALNDQIRARGRFPIASDIGDCLFAAMELAPTPMVAPATYASMGFGVPAGLGLQLTSGERPVILVGDGAFQMTGWELGHCRRYGLDPIVVVLNNQSWEMIRVFEPASRCSALGDWHYADIARSLGGHGERVTTRAELAGALDRAFDRRGPFSLIEVMLQPGDRTATLSRFAEGVRRSRSRTT